MELTGYTSKSPEYTVTQSASSFQANEYQMAPNDDKNRTPSAYMPEGSYDTLAPADEPSSIPSAQVIPPTQNGQNQPGAPRVRMYACVCVELYALTRHSICPLTPVSVTPKNCQLV